MISPLPPRSPEEFAEQEFGPCDLGDRRRSRRLVSIAAAMARSPDSSICALFAGRYAMNASYEFFKQDYAHPDATQSTHRRLVRERCSQPGHYLLLEDTSDVSYSGRKPVPGLAPCGDGKSPKSQSFKLHSVLAARVPDGGLSRRGPHHPPLSLCGLLHQTYTLRQPREKKKEERRGRKDGKWLETDLWAGAAQAIGPVPGVEQVRWSYVADRGADILDHIIALEQCGAGFVIRARHDRRIHLADGGTKAAGKLFAELRGRPSMGTMELELRGREKRNARTATLHISSLGAVPAQSPQSPGLGKNSGAKVILNAVRVWEEGTPQGESPLEWLLLTNLAVDTFEQALDVSAIYSCRWLVEEFHKALKSGMGAEKLQLEDGRRLMSAVAVMSIVALRLLDLRDVLRIKPGAPAIESGLDETELAILGAVTGKPVMTVKDAVWLVARLGGFPGRKGDGEPGMTVLWRGMHELLTMKAGWLLAQGIKPPSENSP